MLSTRHSVQWTSTNINEPLFIYDRKSCQSKACSLVVFKQVYAWHAHVFIRSTQYFSLADFACTGYYYPVDITIDSILCNTKLFQIVIGKQQKIKTTETRVENILYIYLDDGITAYVGEYSVVCALSLVVVWNEMLYNCFSYVV